LSSFIGVFYSPNFLHFQTLLGLVLYFSHEKISNTNIEHIILFNILILITLKLNLNNLF
jgi:hypothetical protein